MLFTELKIGDKELKLRLSTRDCVALEKKLGANPLDALIAADNGKLPQITYVTIVLHAALQKFQANTKMDDVYDLYDEYIENGGTMIDMLQVITEVFKVSGFFKIPEKEAPITMNLAK